MRSCRLAEAEIAAGAWTHVAVALDRGSSRAAIYVNGKEDSVYSLEMEEPIVPGPSRIGNWLKRRDYRRVLKRGFAGRMDEFAMWRRALGPEEIKALVEEGRPSVMWGTPTRAGTER